MNNHNLIAHQKAAEYLGVSVRTLAGWRSIGYPLIPYVKIGRLVKYRVSEIERYINERTFPLAEGVIE